MGVNFDVWGAENTWVAATSATYSKASTKYAATDRRLYRNLWLNEYLPLNEIDISPCYYGIGKGSILNKLYYISPYYDNGTTKLDIKPVTEEINEKAVIFTYGASNSSQCTLRYEQRYAPARSTVVGSLVSPYIAGVVLDFNYQKVKVIPYVVVKDSINNGENHYYSLYDYIDLLLSKYKLISLSVLVLI